MTSLDDLYQKLPPWARSIRFRYTLLYSSVLFGLAALVLGVLYLVLMMSLRDHQLTSWANGLYCVGPPAPGNCVSIGNVELVTAQQFEDLVNERTLGMLRRYTFAALGGLFLASLAVGWVVAGQVLAPIRRITDVARDIQATDLSRRIRLHGPEDELRQLADTFDAMLERLDAAFRSQRQFVADASHELRNPLAIIRTNLDVALADPEPAVEDVRHTLRVVKRASDRMARLVDDMLALARQGAPSFRDEPVDLSTVAAEASEEFVVPAEARQVRVDRSLTPGLTVQGDPDALKRAVANLLENAVRHAPEGSAVQVRSGAEQGWAWVAVTDRGPGIPPEQQERVFDRFWRADKARSRREGGTGLGLAIVRQVVESHGGQVRLHSVPGAGATFVLWLPLAGSGRSRPAAVAASQEQPGQG